MQCGFTMHRWTDVIPGPFMYSTQWLGMQKSAILHLLIVPGAKVSSGSFGKLGVVSGCTTMCLCEE